MEIAATVLAVEKGQVVTKSLETGLKDEMFAYNRNTLAARVIDLLQSQVSRSWYSQACFAAKKNRVIEFETSFDNLHDLPLFHNFHNS